MNYSKFCFYEAPINSLTRKEIENPFLVLEDLCAKRSEEDFQKDLIRFQDSIAKNGKWRNCGADQLYDAYMDICRLIDVLHLINKYSPALGSVLPVKQPLVLKEGLMNDLNPIFFNWSNKEKSSNSREHKNEHKTFLDSFYKSYCIGFIKDNLHNYLEIALDASYMDNCIFEYFGIEQHSLIFEFRALSELIKEGYIIYAKGESNFPDLECCTEISFAVDKAHTTFLSLDNIANPLDALECFFCYYINIDQVYVGLKAFKKMLYKKNVWAEEESPGNLVYLHECISVLIDAIWLLDKKGELEKIIKIDYKLNERYKARVKKSTRDELEQPLLTIRNFYAFKTMQEWKMLLDGWLKCSLSNEHKYSKDCKSETKKDFMHLLKFIEATYLINLIQHSKS